MQPVINNDHTASRDETPRRCASAVADDADDRRPEPPRETDDPAPEEAGYGYGV